MTSLTGERETEFSYFNLCDCLLLKMEFCLWLSRTEAPVPCQLCQLFVALPEVIDCPCWVLLTRSEGVVAFHVDTSFEHKIACRIASFALNETFRVDIEFFNEHFVGIVLLPVVSFPSFEGHHFYFTLNCFWHDSGFSFKKSGLWVEDAGQNLPLLSVI